MGPSSKSQGFSYCLGGEGLQGLSFQDVTFLLPQTCPSHVSVLLPLAPIQPVPPLCSPSWNSPHHPAGPTPDSSLTFIAVSSHARSGQDPVPSASVMGFTSAPHRMLWPPGTVPHLFSRLRWWLASSSPVSSLTPPFVTLSPKLHSQNTGQTRPCPSSKTVSRFPHQYNPDSLVW